MVNQLRKYTIWLIFNFRVYIWFSCLDLYTGSINGLLITFSKVTVRFKLQERKQKRLKFSMMTYICMFWNTVVMQVTSPFYIYNLSVSHGKVYKQHLLICGSSLRLISSQTYVTEDHPFSKRPSLARTSASHRPQCGWFNVSLISEGPAINTNTE